METEIRMVEVPVSMTSTQVYVGIRITKLQVGTM